MKNLLKYTAALVAVLSLAACSPDEFDGANQAGLPSLDGVDFGVNVDQETNQMTASFPATKGVYPIWILNGTSYSTLPEVGYQNPEAGTYTIELKLGNRNGFSQGSIVKTFTFNETKVDYSPMFKKLCDKEWRIANKEPGHLGCGEVGTAADGWWSANADDKKGTGLYDDRITFTTTQSKGGAYSYNPGADGNTYVNKGVTVWGTQNDAEDVDVAIGAQTADWHFEEGTWTDKDGKSNAATYIVLAGNTVFPYVATDDQFANPRFRIETLTSKKLALVYDAPDGSIAWRYVFTSEAEEKAWEGFDPNSEFNLFKGAEISYEYYYAPGWAQIADPQVTVGNNNWTVLLPEATSDQWQAQMKMHTNISTNAATNYDFSILLTADKDLNGVTVKLTQDGDDGNFYFADRVTLKAGEEYIYYQTDMPGRDIDKLMLVLDFGGCQAGTTVEVSSAVLKDHSKDDGTKVPDQGAADQPVADWNDASPTNLWAPVESGEAFEGTEFWFANNDWAQIGDPAWSHENNAWNLTIPEGTGGSQWQGQFKIHSYVPASGAKKYNFYCVIDADADCPGVTIKLTDRNSDDNFFFADRHDIKADQQYVYRAEGISLSQGDAAALSLVFDFGGCPAGANIKISRIMLEEAVALDYNDEGNLWRAVDEGSAFIEVAPWFANNDWAQIANPEWSHKGKDWNIALPADLGGSQWQGQFPIKTSLSAGKDEAINFQCKITADADCPGVTIKLTDGSSDDNFYFADRHDIKADETFVYTAKGVTLPNGDANSLSLFFDFGGSTPGANVTISDIIFEKAN